MVNDQGTQHDLPSVKIIDFGTATTFHRKDINHKIFGTPK